MTKPRCHLEGQVVLLTRRCFERRYYLRPDAHMNRVLAYEVGRYSTRHGQVVHGFMAMSNHFHQVSHDLYGYRSLYMRDLVRETTKGRNPDLGRSDRMWEGRPFGDVHLLDREAIERKLIYTWLNPVRAGLVRRASDWPGFMILPSDWGKEKVVRRPDRFYGEGSPELVRYVPEPPPGYEDMSLEEVKAHFMALLKEAEEAIHEEFRRAGRKFLGAKKVLKIDPFSVPEKPEKRLAEAINPRFASRKQSLMKEAIQRYRGFVAEHRRQRRAWLKGERAVFPAGTVWMRFSSPLMCEKQEKGVPGIYARRVAPT